MSARVNAMQATSIEVSTDPAVQYLLRVGDTCLILGQRLGEWCGHGPVLVFDEVDAGIGGKVGLQVGDTLRRVADHHQVFAISHLPQIAARAHHHIQVSKDASGGVTTANVRVLTGDERVSEVARMLGGDPESDISRAHARELLESARPAPATATATATSTVPRASAAATGSRQRRTR